MSLKSIMKSFCDIPDIGCEGGWERVELARKLGCDGTLKGGTKVASGDKVG